MLIPCIARLHIKINTVHWVISICLFDMWASTCFGIHVPSSGSFLSPCELHEKSNSHVVHRITWNYVACVRLFLLYKKLHRPHNNTLYDELHGCSNFHVTHKDSESSLKMAHGCQNM